MSGFAPAVVLCGTSNPTVDRSSTCVSGLPLTPAFPNIRACRCCDALVTNLLRAKRSLDSEFLRQGSPLAVDQRFRFCIHHNFVGPGPSEAFGRPLARGVNTHLRSVVR